MENGASDGKRIAKNTLLLYGRMLILVLINLYTSRVILDALGQDDFGTYEIVGGVVAMFAVLSGALSAAIGRFITFELGRKDSPEGRLKAILSTSIATQIILAAAIILLAEPIGLWALGGRLNISPERIQAAKWVLHFSIATFAINLISIPYNATIIAHEKMDAFAAISILEGAGKLAIAFAVAASSGDRLIVYAVMMFGLAVLVRLCYGIYCRSKFSECRGASAFKAEKGLFKEMFGFAGWNFIGSSSAILRDQGGNVLLNLFFGTGLNAARGIAMQVSKTVQGFVTGFMTALNPQITKSYAAGDRETMIKLISKGARISYMLLLLIGLPIILNADFLLGIWLKEVPDKAAILTCLAIGFAMSESISNPLITAMLATGNIKKYQLIVGGLQLLNLPVAWACLKFGLGAESILIVAIIISQICLGARLVLLKDMIGLDSGEYVRKVWFKLLLITVFAGGISWTFCDAIPSTGVWGPISRILLSIAVSASVIWTVGLENDEKDFVKRKIRRK